MSRRRIFFLDHRSIYLNSLGDSLSQMGHQLFYQSSWNMKEIEAGIRYFRPEILLTVGCDAPLTAPTLAVLPEIAMKYRLFHIYWATEDGLFHEGWSIPLIRKIKPDMVWTIHPACVNSYRNMGIPALYLNFALNPRLFPAKPWGIEETYEISLVGTTHLHAPTFRMESFKQLLVPLLGAGYDLHIWGYGWQEDPESVTKHLGVSIPSHRLHGYLPYKESARVYHQSKIVLGIQNATDQVSQRTYEILGSGSLMLGSRTPALERLFKDGEELLLSSSPDETLRLISRYLNQPEERWGIGRNGHQAVLQKHTYGNHLRAIWPSVENEMKKKGWADDSSH
ncbi:CgeB family protein [Thermicanus aegyptius]|uniref:CgeB family protein n=1 Tax=Thermicanus aegyptius TaxID=94009 RepID=UPI0003FC15BB|nr:glycosyltransferase [Thermicanus aegyptius]